MKFGRRFRTVVVVVLRLLLRHFGSRHLRRCEDLRLSAPGGWITLSAAAAIAAKVKEGGIVMNRMMPVKNQALNLKIHGNSHHHLLLPKPASEEDNRHHHQWTCHHPMSRNQARKTRSTMENHKSMNHPLDLSLCKLWKSCNKCWTRRTI